MSNLLSEAEPGRTVYLTAEEEKAITANLQEWLAATSEMPTETPEQKIAAGEVWLAGFQSHFKLLGRLATPPAAGGTDSEEQGSLTGWD